jgi:cytolysin-activating lysine-acyltransferase
METSKSSGAARTVAEALGQIVWLLTQSPLHRELPLKELERSFMPAVLAEQFRVFRFGPLPGVDMSRVEVGGLSRETLEQLPLGVAIWGKLSAEAEAKVERGERLDPKEWSSGDRVWLLELVSPFSTAANRLTEGMLLDLVQGPFRDVPFNLHRTDPASGRRERVRMASHLAGRTAAASAAN